MYLVKIPILHHTKSKGDSTMSKIKNFRYISKNAKIKSQIKLTSKQVSDINNIVKNSKCINVWFMSVDVEC